MSAWFVLAAIGLHQACPGDPRFELFSPLFDKVTIKLDPKYAKGGTFTITAKNNSPRECLYPVRLAQQQTAEPLLAELRRDHGRRNA